ncbi:ParB N-terminal domain-containing protein [Microbacterium keratanolyticum]
MNGDGLVELERALDTITVGARLRRDLGDLDELCASIRELGLLQPVTITPDGTLICGARRVEACRLLGMKTIKVWVRSGLSTPLQQMLAEQHENTIRKPYTPTEAAHIYRELKALLHEEAERNMRATRFGASAVEHGGVPTVGSPIGDASKKAALAVTGKRSDLTLQRVLEVERIAHDPATPAGLRDVAQQQLAVMDDRRTVAAPFARVKTAEAGMALEEVLANDDLTVTLREHTERMLRRLEQAESSEEMMAAAREAMQQARAARARPARPKPKTPAVRKPPENPRQYSARAFLMTISETDYWWIHYDAAQIGTALTEPQWEQFDDWIAQSLAFHTAAAAHRA